MNQNAIVAAALCLGIGFGIVFGILYCEANPSAGIVIVGVDSEDNFTGSDIQPLERTTQIEFPVPANTTEIHITFSH